MANTVTYNKHDYVLKMRSRINKPTVWKDIMKVIMTDVRTFVNSAMTTEPSVQTSQTRGSAYTFQDYTLQQDTGTINQFEILPTFIDEADRHQQTYVGLMELADFHGKIINERIESLVLGQHTNWTDFGATDLANTGDDDSTQITVSASNVDDIIRAIKRKIYTNNGVEFAVENGLFIVWRPEDFEMLEAFVQANGFNTADMALKSGLPVQKAFHYMGVDHYLSTSHTANHVFAGIKKLGALGILRGTFGRTKFLEDPAGPSDGNSTNALSGVGIVTRLDYGFDWHATTSYYKEFWVDVNVA